MLRKFFRKRKIKLQRRKIFVLYKKIKYLFQKTKNIENFYKTCFFLTLPKRQQFFTIHFLEKSIDKTFGAGYFLGQIGLKAKFFKRSVKNITGLVMHLKKIYIKDLKYIYMYNIKNYTYRQYLFFNKMLTLIEPNIHYLVHKQSYIPRFLRKRRIKRRVLKLISKL
jgi:hypothetical protein